MQNEIWEKDYLFIYIYFKDYFKNKFTIHLYKTNVILRQGTESTV